MNSSNNKLKISKEELEDKLSNIIIRQTDFTKKAMKNYKKIIIL